MRVQARWSLPCSLASDGFRVCIKILMIIFGAVGTSKWGRSPKFWVASCEFSSVRGEFQSNCSSTYGPSGGFHLVIWAITCISLLASRSRDGGKLSLNLEYHNGSGWSSKALVYLVGGSLSTIATGAVSGSSYIALRHLWLSLASLIITFACINRMLVPSEFLFLLFSSHTNDPVVVLTVTVPLLPQS